MDTERNRVLVCHTQGLQGKAQLVRLRHRRLGASESAGTEHPRQEVISSCLCVQALCVLHVESVLK